MQGKYLMEEFASPTWNSTDERRFLIDTNTGYTLLGTDTKFIRFVMEGQPLPQTLYDDLDVTYHPLGGTTSNAFISSTYSGDGSNHLRISDDWVKLSDNNPIGTRQVGIKIESGDPGSDNDDISLFYNGSTSLWTLNGGGYSNAIIATTGDLTSAINVSESNRWSDVEIDQMFVRRATQNATAANNTSYDDWYSLTDDSLGTRVLYRTNEAWNGFVRSSNWSINSPSTRAIYSTTSNIANTVVERNSSSDIYCNVLHGTATSALYADLAEIYDCDESLPVGTVVGVMPNSEYEVEPYTGDFMNGVIGVVSDSPAYVMNSGSDGLPIALTGKIPVRVIGVVDKGDFLVPVDGGVARKGDINSSNDRFLKFAVVLEDNLQISEKLVTCIIK